jgi:UDP-GlcNAc:undecaprenyl-phosphate/decaprenyl-phosphate GlcNAc-1-phosphate transferase
MDLVGPLAIAAIVSAGGVWVLARIAPSVGAVARVRSDRWHTSGDVPRFAGPALLIAMAPWFAATHLMLLAAVCLIGMVDDIRALTPLIKAAALLVTALIAGWVTRSPWVAVAMWVVCNAVNMLDHADGIAGATLATAFVGVGGSAALAGAGACLGFLSLNYPPARVFMGDGGSLLLGAALVLATFDKGIGETLAWSAVPLLDAGFVTLRRLLAGRKPWIGGADHTGHVLLSLGVPARLLPLLYAAAVAIIGFTLAARS